MNILWMMKKHNYLIKLQIKLEFLSFHNKPEFQIDIKSLLVILRALELKNKLRFKTHKTIRAPKESLGNNLHINAIIPGLAFPPPNLRFQLTVAVPLLEKVRIATTIITV